jgi:hypothetical protein
MVVLGDETIRLVSSKIDDCVVFYKYDDVQMEADKYIKLYESNNVEVSEPSTSHSSIDPRYTYEAVVEAVRKVSRSATSSRS